MNMNNKLLAQMRAATRNLIKKPQVDTNKVIQDALKNASALTQAAQAQMSGLSQANGMANLRSAGDVPDMLAELSRKFGHGGAAANEPAALLPGTFSEGSFTNRAGTRSYKLYVPSNYQGEQHKPTALVVMLHGCTQDPDDFATGTQMNALAEETGCLVVYPSQSRQANSSRCWNWFNAVDQKRDQGEPSIIAGITREIMGQYRIDPAQVYVAGLSAGGAMATIMGTLYPELYAAVGVHSGLPYASAHDLPSALAAMQGQLQRQNKRGKAIPIIVFHGDQDHTVHPTNGDELMVQARDAAHAMAIEPGRVPDGHAFTRTMHKRADGKVHGEHWVIHGAGHAWSGGSARGSYTDGKGPDASREMLRFFSTHR
ncbi:MULTISPECIES: PHB depolymerase family esterase [unclassified Massilia]|uniref:extracellular catalytic domain type 1 short-chain-length polyhydroxyalkanoate depolymerase n=1 Tax=unclassified Massilia TaxID=2609279 RepID=UPI001781E6E5|nr:MULTISPECIES: PHB depolymerase family esterase [unclassified Massilia]MBD8531428.1 PHB depolymerase family esterase [Massilia sp. CFBP 13647]MBD8674318.1 PHB depolymerase family esterase [Massilia sp. CFBP 13721]